MKIVLISDTHESHRKLEVPEGDLLIHAGDITWNGHKRPLQDFNDWLGGLPHKHKIVIPGNHDLTFDPEKATEETVKAAISTITNATLLINNSTVVEGKVVWGSPMTPWFCNWAFNCWRGDEINMYWVRIPDDVDILVTHGPPKGVLDQQAPGREHLGCEMLAKTYDRIHPKLHVFGHIHGGYGTEQENGTTFVNASVMNEAYVAHNAPIVVEL